MNNIICTFLNLVCLAHIVLLECTATSLFMMIEQNQ